MKDNNVKLVQTMTIYTNKYTYLYTYICVGKMIICDQLSTNSISRAIILN